MAAAVEKAKQEAEAKMQAEMAAVEKVLTSPPTLPHPADLPRRVTHLCVQAAEESAARDRAKFQTDLDRTTAAGEGAGAGDGYAPVTVASGRRRASFTGDMAQRVSAAGVANAAKGAATATDDDGIPSLIKATSARVIKEELYDVTITREVQGGTVC